MADTPKFDPAALGLTVETAGYRPASPETGEADTTHQIGYSKALPGGFTHHYGMNGEDLGISKDKSTWESIKPLAAMAGSAFLPGVFNGVLGAGGAGLSGMGLSAGTGALTGATIAGVTGGDPLRGALMGGLGGAASNLAGQYLPSQNGGFTDAQIQQNGGYGAFNNDAVDSMLAMENANRGYGAFNNDALGSRLAQEADTRIFENNNSGYGATNNDVVDNGLRTTGERTAADASTRTSADKLATLETNRDVRGYDGEEIGGTGSNTSDAFPNGTPSVDTQKSIWDKLGDKAKETFTKPDGSIDWSKAAAAAGIVTSVIGNLTASDPPGATPLSTLVDRIKPKDFDTPLPGGGALTSAAPWNTRTRTYSADMQSPIVAGTRGYAEGGEVEGALSTAAPFVGFVQGEGGGQDDLIDASLSAGEYVFDAETVSMLGDGNNEEGARKLDELRASLRAHKRSAPDDQIAPPAQGALSYMNGGQ